ncbi:lipopolysaccharide biosynthesis protein [Thalassospira lucentensis]|uniref:lipopolysaccharide biosynthesis protein n=1 Tax=Thalassospira lucentensis TaxID=168935 RepID=UPI003D2F2D50
MRTSLIKKVLASDLGQRFLVEGLARGTALMLVPLLSWSMGAIAWGGYSQTISLSFAFVPLVSAGLGFSLIRSLAGERNSVHAVPLLSLSIGIITALCLFVAAALLYCGPQLLAWLSFPDFLVSSLWLGLIVLLSWVSAMDAVIQEFLRAQQNVPLSVRLQFITAVVHLGCLALLSLSGSVSIHTAIGALLLARFATVGYGLMVVYRVKFPEQKLPENWRRLAISGIPFMIAGLAEWASNMGDRLLVGYFLGSEAVALYSAILLLLSLLIACGAPFWWLLFPAMVSAEKSTGTDLLIQTVKRYSLDYLCLALAVGGLVVVVAEPLLSLMLDMKISGVTRLVLLMALVLLLNQLTTAWEYFLVLRTGGKRLMAIALLVSLLGPGLGILVAPVWGVEGIAAVLLFSRLVASASFGGIAWQSGFRDWPLAKGEALFLLLAVTVASACALLISLDTWDPVESIAFRASIFVVIYCCFLLIWWKILRQEHVEPVNAYSDETKDFT